MNFDVVVVGMGPVGAAAANLAGMWGLKTLVVDRLPDVYDKPRAFGLDHEVMRIFQNIGIAGEIGNVVMPYRTSEYRTTGGALIKCIAPAQAPFPLGWAPNYVFSQPAVEKALRARLRSWPNVTAMTGTEVLSVTPLADGMAVQLRDAAGAQREIQAAHVLACDGGTSPIRTALGLEMEDLAFDEPWLVVDVLLNDENNARLPSTNVQYCETARPSTFIVGPGVHRRWEFMINPDESPSDIAQPDNIRKLLSRWLAPEEYRLWRASSYRFHALVLKSWRQGNLFFLGDAAHMTPPFMAQGMCQGIRDAANLVWKLALVKSGQASADFLDSYQEERIPHVRHTTLVTKELGQIICERDPDKAAERDRRMLEEMAKNPAPTIRQSLIPGLVSGFIARRDGDKTPGALFPQPVVEDALGREGMLDDFGSQGFRLVYRADVDPAPLLAELDKAAPALPVTPVPLLESGSTANASIPGYRDKDGLLERWMERHECRIVLVRPDHYVYGSASTPEQGVELIREMRRALKPM